MGNTFESNGQIFFWEETLEYVVRPFVSSEETKKALNEFWVIIFNDTGQDYR